MPEPLDRYADRRKKKSYTNWSKRDEELSTKIQEVINELKADKNIIKITEFLKCSVWCKLILQNDVTIENC